MKEQEPIEITKFQKFETKTVLRSEIKGAEYNPRKISEDARKKLKKNIERVGLLDTIVVNKNTMNIVSGHQRISILDTLERKKDYMLTVAMVDLTEQEEKEQNIFFNNTKVMGEYDLDLLSPLLIGIDYENAGLDLSDIGILGVEVDLGQMEEIQSESDKELLKFNNEIYDNKREMRKDIINHSQDNNKESIDTVVMLTFSNNQSKAEFMERFGFRPNDRYVKGEVFAEMVERIE